VLSQLNSATHFIFVDLLVVGVGEPEQMKFVDRDLYRILKEKGVALELLPTVSEALHLNFFLLQVFERLNHNAASSLSPKDPINF